VWKLGPGGKEAMQGALRKLGWIALGLVAVAQAGCLGLAVAGAAAGAGAAGYVYFNAPLYRDYHAGLSDTVAAVRASLTELQFPILEEKPDTGSVSFRSQTGDGHTLRLSLETIPSAIPAEATLTRVSVRVGFSGDDAVSARVLDQISRHLVPAGAPPAPQPGVVSGAARPPETQPPPLAAPAGRLTPVAATDPR
jgi:hypothetical protein